MLIKLAREYDLIHRYNLCCKIQITALNKIFKNTV